MGDELSDALDKIQSIKRNMNEFEYTLKRLKPVLDNRYRECDTSGNGHLKQDQENNYCNYCFRHLSYKTPETDAILESRKNLSIWQQPLDAPFIREEREREIGPQKAKDYFDGISNLEQELSSR